MKSLLRLTCLLLLCVVTINSFAASKLTLDDPKKEAKKSQPNAEAPAADDGGGGGGLGIQPLPEWATDGSTSVFSSVPADILPNKKYIIYLVGDLHRMDYENYKAIVDKLIENNFVVIANPVHNSAYNASYIDAIAGEVRSLLNGGVNPANITVMGFSFGGIAALKVSSLLQNPDVNYIIVGGCPKPDTAIAFTKANQICPVGRILNIYDKEDEYFGRFTPVFKDIKSSVPRIVQEKRVKTGKGHKFGLEPLDDWMNPAIQFAK